MFSKPFSDCDRRTVWLRATLISATILGLVSSAPVWLNIRSFPLLPVFGAFPILPSPFDKVLFGVILCSLVAAIWFYRAGVVVFLATSFIAWCGDQNRGQPWLYMYWVMLLLSLSPKPSSLAANRLAISVLYVWAGIQKVNPKFTKVAPEWFTAPLSGMNLPSWMLDALKGCVAATPWIEIGIGVLLWWPALRRVGLGAVLIVHVAAIVVLGPSGHNYNWVVIPWNLAMIALAFGLFARGRWFETVTTPVENDSRQKPIKRQAKSSSSADASGLAASVADLARSKVALAVLLLYASLPVLSYSGRWDSYFSFALYSENLAAANIFVTESFRENLPAHLQKYATKFPMEFDPVRQGPYGFGFGAWAYEEMHVPPVSEPRNFQNIYRALKPYAKTPSDLRMIVGERGGRVMFYEGDYSEELASRP